MVQLSVSPSDMAQEQTESDFDDEILFTKNTRLVCPELLENVLCVLAKQNDDAVQNPGEYLDYLCPGTTVEMIFHVCTKLRLPLCVQFMAVEYLDRFLVQHVRDIRQQLGLPGSSRPASAGGVGWNAVMARMRDQVPLRMLTCIQIASKMFTSVNCMSGIDVRDMLREMGDTYSFHSLLQSELRVLSTLDYRLKLPSPLVLAEVLLDVIGHNEPSFEPRDLHPVVKRVLQGYYLVRHEVHERAMSFLVVERTASDEAQHRMIRAFWADQLLLASAVVASAVRIRYPPKYRQFIGFLHSITRLSTQEMQSYSSVIMSVLFNEDTMEA